MENKLNIQLSRVFIFALLVFSHFSFAKQFKTPYLSIETSDRWGCQKEDDFAFTCRLYADQPVRDALIIISAKEIEPSDSLEKFEHFLKIPKAISLKNGQSALSEVHWVRRSEINNQTWVEGAHTNSEIPGYTTFYMVTLKGKLSVLVTLSAAKVRMGYFRRDFDLIRSSIKITNEPIVLNDPYFLGKKLQVQNGKQNTMTQVNTQNLPSPSQNNSKKPNYFLMALAVLGVIGLFIYALK